MLVFRNSQTTWIAGSSTFSQNSLSACSATGMFSCSHLTSVSKIGFKCWFQNSVTVVRIPPKSVAHAAANAAIAAMTIPIGDASAPMAVATPPSTVISGPAAAASPAITTITF